MSLRHFIISFFALALLSACSDDSASTSNGAGSLSLDLAVDASLRDPLTGQLIATPSRVPETSEIRLTMSSENGVYAHTWTSFADFPERDLYYSGTYFIDATFGKGDEGFDKPAYQGSVTAVVEPEKWLTWPLTLEPASSVFTARFSEELTGAFATAGLIVHTPGRDYHTIVPQEERMLYLTPGETELYLDLTFAGGIRTRFKLLDLTTVAGCLYDCAITLDNSGSDPVLTCAVAGKNAAFTLTPEFLAALPPVVASSGWEPQVALTVPEGELPETPVRAMVSASAPLSHLYLSTSSAWLRTQSFPPEVDLLHLTPVEESLLSALGLRTGLSTDGGTVDFTGLIGKLVFLTADEALSEFSLLAEDNSGRVSNPLTLRINTTAVDISVTSVGEAPVGASSVRLTVTTPAHDFAGNVGVEILDADGDWTQAAILSVEPSADSSYVLTFAIPDNNDDIRVRILYCEEVRTEFTVERCMPEFDLEIDPFATYALVRIKAADEATVSNVAAGLMLYVDGQRGPVLMRDKESGVLALSGLEPAKTYSLTATMMDRPDASDFTRPLRFVTESAHAIPNNDFEDRKDGVSYYKLPSGGRYSQTMVAIFNWQNSESFSQEVPMKWANTNSKTFCTRASNHNTWYMQPSVFTVRDVKSGEFAVCLRSVGFDLDGEDIPDYTQTGEPYLNYSPIVPRVACRAAGKLFLGEYSFNASTMEETYKDVVNWSSRPRSLNGFYKYTPSPDNPADAGLALIEVYGEIDGERQMIASARAYLPIANSYTAFTAPLTYTHFGVKATGMKLMFASSAAVGIVAEETASVITSADPVKGALLGSTLWLDNISLAY